MLIFSTRFDAHAPIERVIAAQKDSVGAKSDAQEAVRAVVRDGAA